ncbi:MAG: hypothetical protein AMXMBFR56_53290 [Polyangiaceae bacterium]
MLDTRTTHVDCLTEGEARAVSQAVFDVWNAWRAAKVSLPKPQILALEKTVEFRRLKTLHQFWADESRKDKRRTYNAERQAKVRSGTWDWMDPRRVRARLEARWTQACGHIITVLCSKDFMETEAIPPCWSSARPALAGSSRWLLSNDNAKLRVALAGHVEELWDTGQQLGSLHCLRQGPGGHELYEIDFLQSDLFHQLEDAALWRTGIVGREEPLDEELLADWDEPGTYLPVGVGDDAVEWGDPDPEIPVYQSEPMRRPRRVVEDEPDVLNDCQRRIQAINNEVEARAGRGVRRAPSLEELTRWDAQEQARLFPPPPPEPWDPDTAMSSED